MFSISPEAAERYAPALGAAGTTTAVASLGGSYLGPGRGSALAALLSLALGAALRRDGRHPVAAFWFMASGALAGVFSVAYGPVRAAVAGRYRAGSWISGPAFSADVGGQRISVDLRPAAGVQVQDAEFVPVD
jgi:hypothetical protein